MNECFITFPRGVIVNPPYNGLKFFLKEHSNSYPLTFFMRYAVRGALYQTPQVSICAMVIEKGRVNSNFVNSFNIHKVENISENSLDLIHHLHLQGKFQLLTEKLTWGNLIRQNIAGWCQQTYCFQKFVDIAD